MSTLLMRLRQLPQLVQFGLVGGGAAPPPPRGGSRGDAPCVTF